MEIGAYCHQWGSLRLVWTLHSAKASYRLQLLLSLLEGLRERQSRNSDSYNGRSIWYCITGRLVSKREESELHKPPHSLRVFSAICETGKDAITRGRVVRYFNIYKEAGACQSRQSRSIECEIFSEVLNCSKIQVQKFTNWKLYCPKIKQWARQSLLWALL